MLLIAIPCALGSAKQSFQKISYTSTNACAHNLSLTHTYLSLLLPLALGHHVEIIGQCSGDGPRSYVLHKASRQARQRCGGSIVPCLAPLCLLPEKQVRRRALFGCAEACQQTCSDLKAPCACTHACITLPELLHLPFAHES